jgi:hypothetical protein
LLILDANPKYMAYVTTTEYRQTVLRDFSKIFTNFKVKKEDIGGNAKKKLTFILMISFLHGYLIAI